MTASWPALGPEGNVVPFRDNDGLKEATAENHAFWMARPELRSIYQNSRRLIIAPWSLLGMALIRSLHSIPHWVRYQSYQGTASLNAMLVLVGESGGGKSRLRRQADECLQFVGNAPEFRAVEVGSGEAISEMFAHVAEKDGQHRDGTPYRRGDLLWHNADHSVMFGFDEIGRMVKLQGRDGSTVYEYIKQGWSGSELGRLLVGGRGVLLPPDSYRMTAIANAQPERCAPMFSDDEIAGGFPGRLLWMETRDPDAVTHVDMSPIEPYPIKSFARDSWPKAIVALPVMDEAHREDAIRYHRDGRPPIDGHRLLLQAKVAVALMRLNSRIFLEPSDWELADVVLNESVRVREKVRARLARTEAEADTRRGESLARQTMAAERATAALTLKRVTDLLRKYRDADIPQNQWRTRLKSTDRPMYDEALAVLEGRW